MTERLPQSAIALQLLEVVTLNLRLAKTWMSIAVLSDERFFKLRQDMQRNYGEATKEAQILVADLVVAVGAIIAHRDDLPQTAQQQFATIEAELAHIQRVLAEIEEGEQQDERQEGGA